MLNNLFINDIYKMTPTEFLIFGEVIHRTRKWFTLRLRLRGKSVLFDYDTEFSSFAVSENHSMDIRFRDTMIKDFAEFQYSICSLPHFKS